MRMTFFHLRFMAIVVLMIKSLMQHLGVWDLTTDEFREYVEEFQEDIRKEGHKIATEELINNEQVQRSSKRNR